MKLPKNILLGIIIAVCFVNLAIAGVWAPNNFLYEPSYGESGTTSYNNYTTGLTRVDTRLGKEIWVGDPNYGTTFQNAITTIGTSQATLRLARGTYSIDSNLTIPSNITLRPERGAILSVATGITLTVRGGLEAGLYQVFSCTGTGKVMFGTGAIKEIPHQWYGGKTDGATDSSVAVKAAGDAALAAGVPLVFAGGGSVLINTQCKWGNTAAQARKFIHIRFLGESKVISTNSTIDGVFCFEGPHPQVDGDGNRHNGRVLIENPRFTGAGAGGTSKALKFYGIQGTKVQGGYITGFGTASWSSNHDVADFLECYIVGNRDGIVCDDSASAIIPAGMAIAWNLVGIKGWNNTGDAVNIFGGNSLNIRGCNFVANNRDIVLSSHESAQGISTQPVIDGNSHESAATYHLYLGGNTGNGLVRGGKVLNNLYLPVATQTACICYALSLVDQDTVFRDNRNALPLNAPTFHKLGTGKGIHINENGEVDYTETSTIVGFSSYLTKKILYHRVGKRIYFQYYLIGVSNETVITFTLPYANSSNLGDINFPARFCNNGVWSTTPGMLGLPGGSNVVSIYTDWSDSPTKFTDSGTKAAIGNGWYDID